MPGGTVKAARIVAFGAPLSIADVTLAEPDAGEGGDGAEVIVEMAYAGVNPVDRYTALGRVAPDGPLPRTVGLEGVGRLEGRLVVVHGEGLGLRRDGLWAQRAVVPRSATVEVPAGIDPVSAAGVGVAGVTAWRAVTELAKVTADDRVLVLGASGGVGSTIVSLVRSIGATWWGQTGHEGKVEGLRARGAERVLVVVDGAGLAELVADLKPTVVFDPLGGSFSGSAVQALEPRGRLVLFGTSADAEGMMSLQALYRKGLTVFGYGGLTEPADALRRGMEGALAALRDGRMEVAVDDVLPLDRANEALDRLARREVAGKLVLDLGAVTR